MKKLRLLYCIVILVGVSNLLMADDLPDNRLHLRYDLNIFDNKRALIYPNPFSESTTIFYTPQVNEDISIRLYSINGIFIEEIFKEKVFYGKLYKFIFHSEGIEPGVYHCVIETSLNVIHQKLEIIH